MTASPPPPPNQEGVSTEPPFAADLSPLPHPWPGLDRLGFTQALGGLVLGRTIELQQQWGIAFIAASVAIFFS